MKGPFTHRDSRVKLKVEYTQDSEGGLAIVGRGLRETALPSPKVEQEGPGGVQWAFGLQGCPFPQPTLSK